MVRCSVQLIGSTEDISASADSDRKIRKENQDGLLLAADLEKTSDSINHGFLFATLNSLDLGVIL